MKEKWSSYQDQFKCYWFKWTIVSKLIEKVFDCGQEGLSCMAGRCEKYIWLPVNDNIICLVDILDCVSTFETTKDNTVFTALRAGKSSKVIKELGNLGVII